MNLKVKYKVITTAQSLFIDVSVRQSFKEKTVYVEKRWEDKRGKQGEKKKEIRERVIIFLGREELETVWNTDRLGREEKLIYNQL